MIKNNLKIEYNKNFDNSIKILNKKYKSFTERLKKAKKNVGG
jgi:hypothetical protein